MRADVDQMTLEEIRVVGLQAIANELGPVGLVRFLQMFETGKGDYSKERHEWLDRLTVEDSLSGYPGSQNTLEISGNRRNSSGRRA